MIVDDNPIALESLADYFLRYDIGSDIIMGLDTATKAITTLEDPLQLFKFVLIDGLKGQFVQVVEAAKKSGIPLTAVVLYTSGLREYLGAAIELGIRAYDKRIMPADIPGLIKTTS